MKKWILWTGIIFIILIVLLALSGDKKENNIPPNNNSNSQQNNSEVVSKGTRLIGFDYTPGQDITEEQAFYIAKDAGMESAQIYVQWGQIESAPGTYGGEGKRIIDSRKDLFKSNNIKALLSVNAVSETGDQRPNDLKNKAWNDTQVVQRYKEVIDWTMSELSGVNVITLSLGNEVDSTLNSKEDWEQFNSFTKQINEYVDSKYPNIKVGVKSTNGGLTGGHKEELLKLNQNTDAVFATYYPLSFTFKMKDPKVIHEDIGKLISIYPTREIYLIEIGYASSPDTGSSEEKQSEFIKEVFTVWDQYPQIKVMNFLWLHDLSQETVDYFEQVYGSSNKAFLGYLKTLGLRTYEGQDKIAFKTLKEEAKKRGWNIKL